MMKDFESETRHKKILNDIKKKWKDISGKYSERVEMAKENVQKINKSKDKAFKKKILQREKAIKNQLEFKNNAKLEEKEKLNEIAKKNGEMEKNIEIFHQKQEEERKRIEKENIQKSKYKILLILYLYYSGNDKATSKKIF